MRKVALHIVVLLLLGSGTAVAQSITVSGTQTISAISTATAGAQPDAVTTTSGSTTYNVTTGNVANAVWRITARLTSALPAGLTLALQLSPISTNAGTTAGMVTLSTVAQNVVTAITNNHTYNTNGIQYRLTATSAAGQITTTTCTGCVTFTVQQP